MLKLLSRFELPAEAPLRLRGTKLSFYRDESETMVVKIQPKISDPTEEEVNYMSQFIENCMESVCDTPREGPT